MKMTSMNAFLPNLTRSPRFLPSSSPNMTPMFGMNKRGLALALGFAATWVPAAHLALALWDRARRGRRPRLGQEPGGSGAP